MRGKKALLINPWIYDFAAYDMWAKPLGLLYIGSVLRENGVDVELIDCMSAEHPLMDKKPKRKPSGDGKFYREIIEKPLPLRSISRNYSRYGISKEAFIQDLANVKRPDIVLVTSMMTYWYPGVFDVIRIVKDYMDDIPVVLGGIYATLCYEHACMFSGADRILAYEGELKTLNLLSELWGETPRWLPDMNNLDSLPYPCFDLLGKIDYVCIQTSRGCHFRCTYCASHVLNKTVRRRDPAKVVDEIEYWHIRHGVENFAFYDDALLYRPKSLAIPMFLDIIDRGMDVSFHCPNGLHARSIDPSTAQLLKRAGMKEIRLGLETVNARRQRQTGGKVMTAEFLKAVEHLHQAGYSSKDIGVYILCGLPYQYADEVRETIEVVKDSGARPMIAEYSPIPHTALWGEAIEASIYPIEKEPLFQNNTLLPCQWDGLTYDMYQDLKKEASIPHSNY